LHSALEGLLWRGNCPEVQKARENAFKAPDKLARSGEKPGAWLILSPSDLGVSWKRPHAMRLETVVAGRIGPMRRPTIAIGAAKIAFRVQIAGPGQFVSIRLVMLVVEVARGHHGSPCITPP